MKRPSLRIFTALVPLLAGFSCSILEYDPLTELKGDNGYNYNQSSHMWNQIKAEEGDSYIYETKSVSWTGDGALTRIKVENGVVTGRYHERFTIDRMDPNISKVTFSYDEDMTSLGTHDQGFPLITLDKVYSDCSGKYLSVNRRKNSLYFETDNDGILTLCGYVPDNCADDCFIGFRITHFEWL